MSIPEGKKRRTLEQSIEEGKKYKKSLTHRIKRGVRIGALTALGASVLGANLYELTKAQVDCSPNQIVPSYSSQQYTPIPHSPLRKIIPSAVPEQVRVGADFAYSIMTLPGASTGTYFCEKPWQEETNRQ